MSCPPHIREAFALFDKDGDGEVTGQEAALVMRSCGIIPNADDMKNMPATMDWQVFQGIMTKKLSSCDPKADLIKAFKTFDRQGDGTLSADELSQVMKTLGEMLTDEEVEEMIRDADPQKTGRVQYTAFVDQLVSGR